MAPFSNMNGETVPIFYIGHHDRKRDVPIAHELKQQAANEYDMITAPITAAAFYSRVSSVLSNYLSQEGQKHDGSQSFPALDSLDCQRKGSQETYLIPGSDVSSSILTTSSWIDIASPDPLLADISRQVLSIEVQYAAFCGAMNIMIQGPSLVGTSHNALTYYARAIKDALIQAPAVHLHVLLPMGAAAELGPSIFDLRSHAREPYVGKQEDAYVDPQDILRSWEAWDVIRSVCTYSSRLHVASTLPQDLPPMIVQSRWFSESVRILELPSSSFSTSKGGDVMLSRDHQRLIFRFMRKFPAPWLVLSDVGPLGASASSEPTQNGIDQYASAQDPTPAQALQQLQGKPKKPRQRAAYLDYLRDLQGKQSPKDALDQFAAGYHDHLQNPLQPLADNLESVTYEVFEQDPIKYDWYERAIAAALRDWKQRGKPCSGQNGSVCIAVVGAGRGPLVTRAMQAEKTTNISIDLWAVEKNQNAIVLLQKYFHEKWHGRVNVTKSDMRSWKGPFYINQPNASSEPQKMHYSVDILVSELLGSFGDNELSPECLDGVQHLLNPTHGISIPSSYTAHLTPISAPKIHADILTRAACGSTDAHQIPYVVLLHAVDHLSTHLPPRHPDRAKDPTAQSPRPDPIPVIQQAWEFRHPNHDVTRRTPGGALDDNEHNRRFAKLDFKCRDKGVCHGLAGYFETVLYDAQGWDAAVGGASEHSVPSHANKSAFTPNAGAKVELSTNPLTMEAKSKDMISWFPIFFPLKTPLHHPPSSLLTISIWRQTDGRKVWYEWMVEVFLLPPGQSGQQGRKKVRLGVSELHSSEGNGCLM